MRNNISWQEKIDKIQESDTFHWAIPFNLNACVGHNGETGLFAYELGYKEASRILIEKAKDDKYHLIDALIYPIGFCARHYLELFLKRMLVNLMCLCELQGEVSPVSEDQVFGNHHLQALWGFIREITIISDKEYQKVLTQCNPLIRDFYEQDPNSEAFRYPFSKKSEKYLENLKHINVLDFEKQYESLLELFDHLDTIICYELDAVEEVWS